MFYIVKNIFRTVLMTFSHHFSTTPHFNLLFHQKSPEKYFHHYQLTCSQTHQQYENLCTFSHTQEQKGVSQFGCCLLKMNHIFFDVRLKSEWFHAFQSSVELAWLTRLTLRCEKNFFFECFFSPTE